MRSFYSQVVRFQSLQNKNLYEFSERFSNQMKKYAQNSYVTEQNQQKYPQEIMGTADSIARRRREQAKFVELENKAKQDLQIFTEAYTDTVISFQLYYYHTHHKSQEMDAILNYYQIAYKRNMNPLFINNLVNAYPQLKENNKYPILRVHVSLDPVKFVCGNENIMRFLSENDFIVIPKHMTYSVYAKQGVEFTEKVNENLDTMFWNPVLTYENELKSTPETYRDGARSFILMRAIYRMIKKISKTCMGNMKKIVNDKEGAYKNSRKQFVEDMKTWETRLSGNEYHGGEHPDEADFAMLGVLLAKHNSRSFEMFLDREATGEFRRWFLRMRQSCQYEKDRILYNE